nr:hypothetical protein [Prevotella sp.]
MTNVTFLQLIQRGCNIDIHLKVVVATINGVGIHKEIRTFHLHELFDRNERMAVS